MGTDKELNLPDYIPFAYNRFIMTRVEYLIYTQNEQEAKVLRIIEWCLINKRDYLYREMKAKVSQGEKVEAPDIVWCPISHSFLLSQLQGTVQSETTLKEIIKSLKKKHLIFKEEGIGPYDPSIFTINKHLLAELKKLLPESLDQLNMAAIMKHERKTKEQEEGQKLTPSKIDPLVQKIREAINAPLDSQLLALYQAKIDPLLRSRDSQLLPPKIYKEITKETKKESVASDDALSLIAQLQEQVAALQAQLSQQKNATNQEGNTPPLDTPPTPAGGKSVEAKTPRRASSRSKKETVPEQPALFTPPPDPAEVAAEKERAARRAEMHRIIYGNLVKRRGGELGPNKTGMDHKYIKLLIELLEQDEKGPEFIDRCHEQMTEHDWRYRTLTAQAGLSAKHIYDDYHTLKIALKRVDDGEDRDGKKAQGNVSPHPSMYQPRPEPKPVNYRSPMTREERRATMALGV